MRRNYRPRRFFHDILKTWSGHCPLLYPQDFRKGYWEQGANRPNVYIAHVSSEARGSKHQRRETQTQQTSSPAGSRSRDTHLRPRFGTRVPPEIACVILVSPALSRHPASLVELIPSTTVFWLARGLAPLLESCHHGNDHHICFSHCFTCVCPAQVQCLVFWRCSVFFFWVDRWLVWPTNPATSDYMREIPQLRLKGRR